MSCLSSVDVNTLIKEDNSYSVDYNHARKWFSIFHQDGANVTNYCGYFSYCVRYYTSTLSNNSSQPLCLNSDTTFCVARNFFEMVRFDFVLDEDLKLYLMEVSTMLSYHYMHIPTGPVELYEKFVSGLSANAQNF